MSPQIVIERANRAHSLVMTFLVYDVGIRTSSAHYLEYRIIAPMLQYTNEAERTREEFKSSYLFYVHQ